MSRSLWSVPTLESRTPSSYMFEIRYRLTSLFGQLATTAASQRGQLRLNQFRSNTNCLAPATVSPFSSATSRRSGSRLKEAINDRIRSLKSSRDRSTLTPLDFQLLRVYRNRDGALAIEDQTL